MAVFLAAAALGQNRLPAGLPARMREILSVAGAVEIDAADHCILAYCDLGLWPGRSAKKLNKAIAVVAGDPVLETAAGISSREQAIEALALDPSASLLAQAHGTYCGIQWCREKARLVAFTDKLGVRPIYFAQADGVVYVSTSQWALDALSDIPKEPDWRGAAEVGAFGFALADRTLFANRKTLYPGERLVVDAAGARTECYWDWRTIPVNRFEGAELLEHVRRSFNAAVDDRIGNHKRAMAFLSGGMDSRLIVARLREKNLLVYTLNFAPAGSQDLVFGRMAAEALQTDHFEFGEGGEIFSRRQAEALAAWRAAHPDPRVWPESPGLFWSGDGGSVTLGHVYLTDEMLQAARTQDPAAVARIIQRTGRLHVSKHVFRKDWRELVDLPLKGIEEDLRARPQIEPGRNCHYFFMLNDQRRHLVNHYEVVHLKRADYVLPFFDARFVAAVLGSPIEAFMRHALYNDWMAALPGGVGQVPWQAYPGHVPCPIPAPSDLRRQWQDGWLDPAHYRREQRKQYKAALGILLSRALPGHILNRFVLIAACLAGYAGIGEKAWVLKVVEPYRLAWNEGRSRPSLQK